MEQPVFLLSFSWVTWLTCLHDQIDHVYSRALQTVPLCSNFILCNHYRVRDKYPPAHTHTHTRSETQALLPMHLAGVDNHKDLLNGGDRSSLYQVYLYRPGDKWGRHNGWGRGAEGPYNAPDRIETTEWALVLNRAGLPPCLMNPPKLQEGRQMWRWVPASHNTELERWKRNRKSETHFTSNRGRRLVSGHLYIYIDIKYI